jgi:hypothetical protein
MTVELKAKAIASDKLAAKLRVGGGARQKRSPKTADYLRAQWDVVGAALA